MQQKRKKILYNFRLRGSFELVVEIVLRLGMVVLFALCECVQFVRSVLF